MITCKLIGPSVENNGLGNQLFQIAAAISYAKDHDIVATFPGIEDPSYGGYNTNILKNVNSQDMGEAEYQYTEPTFGFSEIPKKKSICINSSYLQSYKYFEHNRELILNTFKMSSSERLYLITRYNPSLLVGVHIRRGDYLKVENFHTNLAKTSYYQEAMAEFPGEEFLIFSDDPDWARKKFPNSVVAREDDYLELYLMSLCKAVIIANSTFSWWGAWLNKNPNKRVIAPKNWFGPANKLDAKDLIPPTWRVL
jgi:hypothetical protein